MYKNTILCCDLKTILSSDRIMKAAKDYTGILRREVDIDGFRYDEHFSIDGYAIAVCNELREALEGLVGEE